MSVEIFAAPTARLGSQALILPNGVAVADLDHIRRGTGNDVYGIIGMDFLRGRAFRLDPAKGTLTFLGEGTPVAGDWVPLIYNRFGVPLVSADIAGFGPEMFRVDTGTYGTGILCATTFRSLLDASMLRVTDSVGAIGLSAAKAPQRVGIVESISLGRSTRRRVRFGEAPLSALGMWYWCDFVVTFDFRNDCLNLIDSPRADRVLDGDPVLSGIYVERRDGRVLVTSVRKRSPAADAGVRKGDVILSIDDLDARSVRLHSLCLRLMREGAVVNLTVRRCEETLKLELALDGGDG